MPVPKSITADAIRRELDRRANAVAPLQRKLARLRSQAAILERQIEAMGGSVGGGSRVARPYPRNEQNLAEALAAVLKGKHMRVNDMMAAVQKAGYKTTSPNFRPIVHVALAKPRFKRVARGVYTVRK